MKPIATIIMILAFLVVSSMALLKQERQSDAEEDQWRIVKLIGSKKAYEDFIQLYPDSSYRNQAISALNNIPFNSSPRQSQIFADCLICPDMIVLPAGEFQRGSKQNDEQPISTVTLSKNFAVGRFEISYEQWMICASLTEACSNQNPSYPIEVESDPDLPVVDITWNQAQEYVRWLSDVTGFTYRLLTEAEWEYAARAGTNTDYSWGNELPVCDTKADNGALFDDGTKCPAKAPYKIGSFKPNAFGLYDMHGNVWEWVQDCYQDSYVGAPVDGSSTENCQEDIRILRGGAYSSNPHYLRSANRNWTKPDDKSYIIGFRVARDIQ